jgi:nicotinate-nucleotide adenylyltransferase
VGILGGTFNPPHLGHLGLARGARAELGLERVVLMPAHGAPHKPAREDPGPEHRLEMCRLAIADVDGLSVCELEIERGGPSYTVDTLRVIYASHKDAQLTLVVGADTARTLPAWREPGELLGLADLAVAARAGSTGRREMLDIVTALTAGADSPEGWGGGLPEGRPAVTGRRTPGVRFLEMGVMEVSSSLVRGCVARGEPVEDLVAPAVGEYIAEHGLYRGRSGVGS